MVVSGDYNLTPKNYFLGNNVWSVTVAPQSETMTSLENQKHCIYLG